MRELAIDVAQYGLPEGIAENIAYSATLGLPELNAFTEAHDKTIIVAGSGPSLAWHIDKLREDKKKGIEICAVKGAYDYLRGRGITPEYYLSVEPRYRPVENPSHETVYLLSSRVNQKMFDDLDDFNVVLWHSWSDQDEVELDPDKMHIGGGSTSGLRAVNVFYVKGYRKVKFYGMDSCLGMRGEKRVDQEPLADHVSKTNVIVGEREFLCNMAMAAQAQDFQSIYDVMPDISIECCGDGLISAIIEERKKQGFHT